MDRTEQVIKLVRRIDRLEADRESAVAPFDAQIAAARKELAELIAGPHLLPAPKGRKSDIGEKFLDHVRHDPTASFASLAQAVYGENTPDTRHKARAQAWNLKKAKKLRGEPGAWEPISG